MLHEKDIQTILCKYPELIDEGLTLVGQEITIEGRRIDILYKDPFGRQLLIELKAGPIKDEHIGQIMSYVGRLLSSENPTLRVMLVGTRVPPIMQRSLDHLGIAWREITISRLRDFLMEKNEFGFLALFDPEPIIKPLKQSDLQEKQSNPSYFTKPTVSSLNIDDMIQKFKSSTNYLNLKAILPLKTLNENRVKEILLGNLGHLTAEDLKMIIRLVDEPYPILLENGKPNRRPWFGNMMNTPNTQKLYKADSETINKWFYLLTNHHLSIEERIDQLRLKPTKIDGLNIGFITLMIYILDKPNYLIWFKRLHSRLSNLYPELGEFHPSGKNYLAFNEKAKEFAEKYEFDHTEIDFILSVGI